MLIVRDPPDDVPRIYGDTRAEAMWAAGYVTAEDRLFFMDVLRHTAEGTTAELLGPSAAASDSAQLGLQDASPQQLTAQMQSLPQTMGAEGSQALNDIEQYVAGINAFINLTKVDPARLPAEYPALGITPQPWTLADSAAVGVYLIGQFTVFGGQQPQQAEALAMAQRRLGNRAGAAVYRDLRLAADPEAVVTIPRKFHSDATGPVNPRSVAMIDPGSLVARNAQTGGTAKSSRAVAGGSHLPGWAQRLAHDGLHLPHLESNAVLVDAQRSGTGQALAVMGPQVGYYTPEVFLEYELHAPGIDVSGVSFPGSSPYPLIGHGIDYAWTGTSAYSANEDVFAERLCNPDGSRPSFASTHYLYRGRCIAFSSRDVVESTPTAPDQPERPADAHPAHAELRPRADRALRHRARRPRSHWRPLPPPAGTRPRATSPSCAWPRTCPPRRRASSPRCAPIPAARTGSTSTTRTSPSCSRVGFPATPAAAIRTSRSGGPGGGTGAASSPPATTTSACPTAPTRPRSTPSRGTWSTGTTPSPIAGGWPPGTGRAGPWSARRCSRIC